ncbi:MAG: cytochrome c family protein [Gammaproteobacteria bacterium]|nr:MAG: cytochrome c family protein [Gammaproteobacteria bacterium]
MQCSPKVSLLLLSCSLLLAACGGRNEAPQGGTGPAAGAAGYDLEALLASADPKRGETLFLQCRACHSVGEGEPHKVGPNLHGVFGRRAGTQPGFAYSEALKESGVTWTPETLDRWLERPSEFIPGNKMVFIGIRDPADRAALIAWLRDATGA